MLNLIKLELKKFKFRGYIKAAFRADMVLLSLLYFIVIMSKVDNKADFKNYDNIFLIMNSMINITFIVFAGVLIGKLIIEEYKNKTIYVLFSYPISRKKIILAKLILIAVFTFLSILISYILIFSIFYITELITPIMPEKLGIKLVFSNFTTLVISAVFNSIISLIPLYFGFRKKSVPTTILTSFIVVATMHSGKNGTSLSSITIVPIIFAVIGIIMTYLTIKDIDNKDVTV